MKKREKKRKELILTVDLFVFFDFFFKDRSFQKNVFFSFVDHHHPPDSIH